MKRASPIRSQRPAWQWLEAVTYALLWIASRRDSQTTQGCSFSLSVDLYPLILVQVTATLEKVKLRVSVFLQISSDSFSFKLRTAGADIWVRSHAHCFFDFGVCLRGNNWRLSGLQWFVTKTLTLAFSRRLFNRDLWHICIMITSIEPYTFIPISMTFT